MHEIVYQEIDQNMSFQSLSKTIKKNNMAEQWVKYLQKQTQYMRKRIESVLVLLKNGQTQGLDIKQLKGYKGIYRVRIGDVRLIYRIKLGSIEIVSLGSRGDIYKDFTL